VKSHRYLLAAVAAIFFPGTNEGFASIQLDWTIASLTVEPQPAVSGPVTVGCAWKAKVTGNWKFEYEENVVQWRIFVWDVATNGNTEFFSFVDYELWPPTGKSYTPGVTTDFDGSRKYTANLSAGPHKVSCQIDGKGGDDADYDDYQEITFDVKIPVLSFPTTPGGGGTVMATTPQLPPVRRPPPVPWITPVITPPSPYRRDASPAIPAVPEGRIYKIRAGEELALVDGRALTIQAARLVLLDASGKVLRLFPPGVVVRVDSAGEVSLQSGPLNVPLGVAKRNEVH
jgi:hypothetical protein